MGFDVHVDFIGVAPAAERIVRVIIDTMTRPEIKTEVEPFDEVGLAVYAQIVEAEIFSAIALYLALERNVHHAELVEPEMEIGPGPLVLQGLVKISVPHTPVETQLNLVQVFFLGIKSERSVCPQCFIVNPIDKPGGGLKLGMHGHPVQPSGPVLGKVGEIGVHSRGDSRLLITILRLGAYGLKRNVRKREKVQTQRSNPGENQVSSGKKISHSPDSKCLIFTLCPSILQSKTSNLFPVF